jgi:hypothetical protein
MVVKQVSPISLDAEQFQVSVSPFDVKLSGFGRELVLLLVLDQIILKDLLIFLQRSSIRENSSRIWYQY